MTKAHNILAILLILLILALPTLAQEIESTEEPGNDVTVIVESPTPDSETVSQTELIFAALFLVSLLVNALQAFYLNKSVPADLAARIFAGARLLAAETQSKADDKIVDIAEKAYNELAKPQPPVARD